MSGKNVLITGGLGNLGSWISIYLAQQGYTVYVLTRADKHKLKDIKYKIIECDITNLEMLEKKLGFEIDYCIHCASFNEGFLPDYPKRALEINALGTRNLLEILSKKNLKHFVYFSTFHVYGENSGVITEESSLNPKSDYASTHLFAEYYIKQFGSTHNLKYTILRLTNSYGAPTFLDSDKWYLVLNDLTKLAYKNGEIIIKSNGNAKRDFIYMGDVAEITEKLLKKSATNDVYNLSSNQVYKITQLADIVKDVYQKRYNKSIQIYINENDKNVYSDIYIDNKKLKKIVSFKTKDMMAYEVNKIFNLLEKNEN